MHAAEGVIAGGRAQDRRRLAGFDRRGGRGRGGHAVELDVQQAGRLVGPFDIAAKLVEVPALVAEEGALGDAGVGLAMSP